MKDKTALAIMLVLLFASFLVVPVAGAERTPRLYLNPTAASAAPGISFSVDVVLEEVTNLVGWEFTLFWNNSILECAADVVHIPAGYNWEVPNNFDLGGIQQDYNATSGRYHKALVTIPEAEPYPTPFNGTTTLVSLTFNAKAGGSCILELRDTKLVNYDANPIDHKAEDGYFESQPTEKTFYLRVCGAIARAFGTKLGDQMWKPFADINLDGIIDIYDMVLVTGAIEETA